MRAAATATLTGDMSRMFGWPATPSEARFRRAVGSYTAGSVLGHEEIPTIEQMSDVTSLGDCVGALNYRAWAIETYGELEQESDGPNERDTNTEKIASQGASESTMGLALLETNPARVDGKNAIEVRVLFNECPRNPEWMGYCALWAATAGLWVFVHEHPHEPREAGFITASPQWALGEKAKSRAGYSPEFPSGSPSLAREICQWHGATQTIWVPTGN